MLALGAPGLGDGAVLVYRETAGAWQLETTLTPSDPALCSFGADVAIDGEWMAVTASCQTTVVFFREIGGVWTEVDDVLLPSVGACCSPSSTSRAESRWWG